MFTPHTLVSLALVLLIVTLFLRHRRASVRKFPPGPTPLPLLGNAFDIPFSREHHAYKKLGDVYGDVVHVGALGRHAVVLNHIQPAKELLSVRSAIYADRPYVPMLHEPNLMDMTWSFVFQRYTPTWRRQRSIFVQFFSPTSTNLISHAQTSSAHALLQSLLNSPEQFLAHIHHVALKTAAAITYGCIVEQSDTWVSLSVCTTKKVADGVNPGIFVNAFPWLKHLPAWLPGTGFKAFAADVKKSAQAVRDIPFESAKTRLVEGTASPSFVTNMLADNGSSDLLMLSDIKSVAATIYAGSTHTTVSSIQSCFLGLVLNPHIQKRAQAELDDVLGPVTSSTFRLPTFADLMYCPYIDAIVKESLRWLPVAPLGIPRQTLEDDVYRDWQIPKGTVVVLNVWAILHDEQTYPDPHEFRPERYLGENPAPHPGTQGCFGFGRRQCPGRVFAENWIWIQIATVLAAFTLSPAKDEDGNDIDVSYACDPPSRGFILSPGSFPCTITPRSKEAELRIRETHSAQD